MGMRSRSESKGRWSMSVDNRTVVDDTLDLMIRYCNDVAYIDIRSVPLRICMIV